MSNSTRQITTRYTDPVEQLTSPKTLTDTWADVVLVDSRSFRSIVLFMQVTINDSLGVGLRIVGLTEPTSAIYNYPLLTTEDDKTSVDYDEYYLKNDENQNIMLEMALCPAGYSKLQVKVDTVGSTAATIDSMMLSVTK